MRCVSEHSRPSSSSEETQMKKFFSHETAIIDDGAEIGTGSKIWHFSHICKGAKIGENVSLGQNCFIADAVEIGDNTKIQNNVSIYSGVVLEESVFCGPSVVFTNVSNPRAFVERKNEYKTTLVKKGASLGANSTIVCGCTIGEYSFIGAGAVITKDTKRFSLMVGIPAKQIGWISAYGERLNLPLKGKKTAICEHTGVKYILNGDNLEIL